VARLIWKIGTITFAEAVQRPRLRPVPASRARGRKWRCGLSASLVTLVLRGRQRRASERRQLTLPPTITYVAPVTARRLMLVWAGLVCVVRTRCRLKGRPACERSLVVMPCRGPRSKAARKRLAIHVEAARAAGLQLTGGQLIRGAAVGLVLPPRERPLAAVLGRPIRPSEPAAGLLVLAAAAAQAAAPVMSPTNAITARSMSCARNGTTSAGHR
jgi:hypothetical protein